MKSNVVTLAIAALVTLASPYSHASLYEQLSDMPSIEQPSSPGVIDNIRRRPWTPPAIDCDWVGQQELAAANIFSGERRYDPDMIKPMNPEGLPEELPRGFWPRHWNWVA